MTETTVYNCIRSVMETASSITRVETLPSRVEKPCSGSQKPGKGSHKPGNGSQKPGSGSQKPGSCSQKPDSGSQKPGSGSQKPDSGSQKPGSGSQKPGSGSQKPGSGSHKPGSGSQKPGSGIQNPGNGSPGVLQPFRHQVAGQSLVFRYDAGTICKSLISRELRVYQTMPDVLKPHVPQYRGVVDIALNGPQTNKENKEEEEDEEEVEEERKGRGGAEHPLTTQRLLDKVVKHQEHDNVYHFLLLENIVSGYHRPCVLDLKLGTRQHGDDAPSHKARYQVNKCLSTTSALLGVRLCGMKVYQSLTGKYIKVDKIEGRNMRENDFRDAMRHFLFNGHHVRRELIPFLLMKLQRLKAAIADCPSFRFYSSSLLVVYDGREFQCKCKSSSARSAPCANGCLEQGSENRCGENHGRHHADSVHDRDGLKKRQTAGNMDPNLSSAEACNNTRNDVASEAGGTRRHVGVPFQDSLGGSPDEQSEQKQQQFQTQPQQDGAGTFVCQKRGKGGWNEQPVPLTPNSSTWNTKSDRIEQQTPPDSSSRESVQQPASFEGNTSPTSDGCTDRNVVVEAENPGVSNNRNVVVAAGNPSVSSLPSSMSCRRSPKGNVETDSETRAGHGPSEPRTELEEPGSRENNNKTASLRKGAVAVACDCYSRLVEMRMVDFAHTTHAGLSGDAVVYEGPDQGCLLGLSSLIRTFTDIYDHTDQEEP